MKKFIFILILFYSFDCELLSQTAIWKNYVYGTNKINSLVEDGNYLWIGTDVGLVKFDKLSGHKQLFNKSDGLPADNVNSITIDKQGNVWIGTGSLYTEGGGIAKFDGNSWIVFDTSNSNLYSNTIQALHCDKSGTLWIGCQGYEWSTGYLMKYDGIDFSGLDSIHQGYTGRNINVITSDSTTLWIGTENGLLKYDGNVLIKIEGINYGHIKDIIIDSMNTIWIGAIGGLFKYGNSALTTYSLSDTLIQYDVIESIASDKLNNIWIGTSQGLIKFDGTKFIIWDSVNSKLSQQDITKLLFDKEKNLWIGSMRYNSQGHFYKYFNNNLIQFSPLFTVLPSPYINSIGQDKDGDIWITYNDGFAKFDNSEWIKNTLDSSDFSTYFLIGGFIVDSKGCIWFGARSHHPNGSYSCPDVLIKYNDNNYTIYHPINLNLINYNLTTIAIDNSDNIWLGTNHGLMKFDGTNWDTLNWSLNFNITKIYIDNNIIWAGTPEGLIKKDENVWSILDKNNSGLPDNYINDIVRDFNNNLWVCTSKGLAKFHDNIWETFTTKNSPLSSDYISSIVVDSSNNKWIGTLGLMKYDDIEWKLFDNYNSPLKDYYILKLSLDKYQNIWMFTNNSEIFVLNEKGILDEVLERNNCIPSGNLHLYQNYPNPFNPKTKIKFTVPTPPSSSPLIKGRNEVGFVTLKVYDILGNEVASLVNEQKPAGNYEVEFDGSNISSGVYFYQLKAGNFLEMKKFVLMK
jgi:ligand-binding sensor domain-containing protein